MKALKILFNFYLLFFIATTFYAQKREVKIVSKKLTEQVYMLKGQGGILEYLLEMMVFL